LYPAAFSIKEQTMSKHTTVVVNSIRLLAAEPGATVRALADITIDNHLHLCDLRIVQPKGQRPYIQPPLVKTIRPDGTPHYTFKATWEPTLHAAIEVALLDAYKAAKGAKRLSLISGWVAGL
jgi:DNA-binding cell septation regulator SpoVG